MAGIQPLSPGQRYRVVRAFVDYDQRVHPVGETWMFEHTSFLPYEDGLTLHVRVGSLPVGHRRPWRPEEQAALIENFTDFVVAC